MADNKTKPTGASVDDYIASIASETRRADCRHLIRMMSRVTGEPPRMWGPSIVGFGSYHYRYESGREGDFFLTGFASRKGDLVLYVMPGFEPFADLMPRLGRHRTGKSCLYVKRLADLDPDVLEQILRESVRVVRRRHEG
jgi:hypothetical protein